MSATPEIESPPQHGDVLSLSVELIGQEPPIRDLGNEVQRLLELHQLDRRSLEPSDSASVQSEAARGWIVRAVDRFRAQPEEVRNSLPALANALGKLMIVAGQFPEAQSLFEQLAGSRADAPREEAEARHNLFVALLEQRQFPEALAAIQRAAELDSERYAPFPLGKYEPERILGAGGFGVAYLCTNRHSGSRLVIKALRTDGLDRNVGEVFREARLLEDLDHQAIVRIRDCDYVDHGQRHPFVVMDYFSGQTLAEFIEQNGPLAPEDFLPLAQLLAEGLAAAHARDILHRDVKPANLLVQRDDGGWKLKIIDFGLALKQNVVCSTASVSASRINTTVGLSIAGTIDYAAPEQLGRGDAVALGPFSDIYGFGKTCYFALLGTPDPDDEEKDSLPTAWRRLISNCTTRNVNKRLASFSVVLERLRQIAPQPPDPEPDAVLIDASAELDLSPVVPPGPEEDFASEFAEQISNIPEAPEVTRTPEEQERLDKAQGLLDRGLTFLARGRLDQAVADFTSALALDDRLAMAYFQRGDALRLKGDYDNAAADFQDALRLDPRHVSAYINLGRTYRLLGEYEKAIDSFSRAVEVDPNEADAYNNRGNVYSELGDYDQAVTDYSRAIELDPQLAPAYMNRALAHAKRGQNDAVIHDCNQALRLNNKLTSAYYIRGTALAGRGLFERAIQDFTTVLRLDPRYTLAYNDRGLAFAHLGQFDRAIQDYQRALRLDPKLLLAYMNLAIAYRLKGDYDQAIEEFTKILRLHPSYALAFYNRGLAHEARRDFARAIADYQAAARFDPTKSEQYQKRIAAAQERREKLNKHKEQRERQAAAKEERERRQSRATAFFTRAQMHFDNERYDRAITDFTEALKFDPRDAFIYHNRGLAHAANDSTDAAIADYSKALQLDPEMTTAYFHRGVAYRLKGNFARAVADFSEAIARDPNYALAYRNRGLAHASLGEQERARKDFEAAVRLDPSLAKK